MKLNIIKQNKFLLTKIALISLSFYSCNEDFITVEPEGKFTTENYYKNRDQAFAALVATYDRIYKHSGSFENMITFFNAASDDCFSGGGDASDGLGIQGISTYTINPTIMPSSYWNNYYKGISRANILLEKLPLINMDSKEKARFSAEAKALRAIYYFELLRMFKNIPLIIKAIENSSPEMYNIEQSNPQDVYNQIEKDLLESLNDLPDIVSQTETARISKGAAKALLGKVYLYQGKNNLAAEQFADVNGTIGQVSKYGYKLLEKFSDLWVVSNKFNSESILEVSHTDKSNTGWESWLNGSLEGNTTNLMVGPRSYEKIDPSAPDLVSGWSFNTVTNDLYQAMKNDPRFSATIFDAKALVNQGKIKYTPAHNDTGYFINKFIPYKENLGNGGIPELNFPQNTYIIRLADTYLMEAEALGGSGQRAQALLDAVRSRVGLPSVAVSLENIKNERRLELACEGHRWFDLVRWKDAPKVLSSKGFKENKNEILPIPYLELENTKIKQNPGY